MSASKVVVWLGSEGWLAAQVDAARKAAEEWVPIRSEGRTPGRFYEELRSYSFFGLQRTVWIEGGETLAAEDRGELLEALAGLAPNVRVFVSAAASAAGDKLAAAIAAVVPTDVQREGAAGGSATVPAAFDRDVSPDLRALLSDLYSDQPLKLALELEKAALFDPDGPVTEAAWRAVSSAPGVVDGFRFARAVLARDLPAAQATLNAWIEAGGSAHSAGRDLLGAVAYVLRQALTYRLLIARRVAPPEAARKTPGRFGREEQDAVSRWKVPDLAAALSDLMALDRQLKRSRVPADVALFAWCLRAISNEAA